MVKMFPLINKKPQPERLLDRVERKMNPDDPICYLPRSSYLTFLKGAVDGVIGLKTHMASIEWLDGIKRNTWVKVYGANSPARITSVISGVSAVSSAKP